MRPTRALKTVLVCLTHCVQLVNWPAVAFYLILIKCSQLVLFTWIAHWSITENETVAAIGPVLALVEIAIVVLHHFRQLRITPLRILTGHFDRHILRLDDC